MIQLNTLDLVNVKPVEGSLEFGHKILSQLTATVNSHSGSEASFALGKRWLENCLSHHKNCGSRGPAALPSRLLEICPVTSRVFLRECTGQMGRYVALSYCWGKSGPKKIWDGLNSFQNRRKGVSSAPQSDADFDFKTFELSDDYYRDLMDLKEIVNL